MADLTPEPFAVDEAHLIRQREWSSTIFGPGDRTEGVLDHIAKELEEVRAHPEDVSEWADVLILAFDGAWRAGHEPQATLDAIAAKQAKNEAREWPDWRTAEPGKAIEHKPSSLREAINKVMETPPPGGYSAPDVLAEIHDRWPGSWPLISWLDIHDEMEAMYGSPRG